MDKLDFSKPEELQTRDGRQVRIYATDGDGAYPIHGAVFQNSGWALAKWTLNGCNNIESCSDLVRKPDRVTGWVNVYYRCLGSKLFKTQEAAQKVAGKCLGQIYIDAEIQNYA